MCLLLLLVTIFAREPALVETVTLSNTTFSGAYIFTKYAMGRDGTVLIYEGFYVYHYDRDGTLIRRMGGRGNGPGEFGKRILETAFDGQTYYIFANNGMWHLFDKDGHFIRRDYRPVRGLQFVGNQLYASQLSQGDFTMGRRATVGMFYERQDHFPSQFQRFHPTAEKNNKALGYRFSLVFFLEHKGKLLAVNELEPKLYHYSLDRSLIKVHGFQAPNWQDPPKTFFHDWRKRNAYATWWCSFPKMRGLAAMGENLVIPMEIPDPEEATEPKLVVHLIRDDGTQVQEPFKQKALYLGVYDQLLHLIHISEDDDALFPTFQVRRYRW